MKNKLRKYYLGMPKQNYKCFDQKNNRTVLVNSGWYEKHIHNGKLMKMVFSLL